MRNNLLSACTVAALLPLLSSCSDSPTKVDVKDPLRMKLVAEGFPERLIAESGDLFIIDGDIVLRKKDVAARTGLIALGPQRPQFQWGSPTLDSEEAPTST